MENKKIVTGVIWKGLERFGVLGIQFVIQMILARMLEPSSYGTLAVMMVFVNIANVLIQNGFNTALIQNRDVKEQDYSSVLWMTMIIAFILYICIFFCAPVIETLYKVKNFTLPFRVLALGLFPGAVNSIQVAKITRNMNFRNIFISNIIASVASGVVGIVIAYCNGGIWALVIQNFLYSVLICCIMMITIKLKIQFKIRWNRVRILFAYGWKLVVSSVLNTVNEELKSLLIGLKFDTAALGVYSRGMQFPQYGVKVIQGTLQSVLLPAMSEKQTETVVAKSILQNAICMGSYLVFPVMVGFAAIARPFISIFLTEKWIACVPYMQIFCMTFAFYPVFICNLQAMNAMGRSDLYLKLEIIKQMYSLITLVIVIFLFNNPIFIAISSLILTPIGWYVNSFPNRKLLNYGFCDQVKDVAPSIIMSMLMFALLSYGESLLDLSNGALIITEIIVGALFYICFSALTKNRQFLQLIELIKSIRKH